MNETTTRLRPRAEDMTPDEVQTEGHFGFCPECHRVPAEYINVGRGHFFVCPECKVYWYGGSNLFSSCREQTEEQQRAIYNETLGDGFRRVEDSYYPPMEAIKEEVWGPRLVTDDELPF